MTSRASCGSRTRSRARPRRTWLPGRLGSLAAAAALAACLAGVRGEAQLLIATQRAAVGPGLYGARTDAELLYPQRRRTGLPVSLFYAEQASGLGYTNYARDLYERYRSPNLEGYRFFDNFGGYVGQGWQIYNWTETAPEPRGSVVDLGAEFADRSKFSEWFSNVLISASGHGQYHSAITVSSQLRTAFTPLTFSKPRFNGVQWDVASDKYAATLLASRVSSPLELASDYGSRLLAGHGEAQVGDFARVGVTWANVHNTRADESVASSPLSGLLTGPQNSGNVDEVTIVIADDSPETPTTGAALIVERVLVDGVFHPEIEPVVRGGVAREGRLEVAGGNVIELTYNIRDDFRPTEAVGAHTEIRSLEFELVVANDYNITATSNKQVTQTGTKEQSFLPVARAAGEVTDGSNQRFIRFAYGLPTAHEIVGVNLELADLGGLKVGGEYAVNRRFRRFPNQNFAKLRAYRHSDEAYYLTALYRHGPWYAYGEGYHMDTGYSTSAYIADADGVVDYHPRSRERYLFEFVDDNDDQDEFPDWYRRGQSEGSYSVLGGARNSDLEVFPGLDANNDYISDFNQNQNSIPDYAEPCLRYGVDAPEFLFGMDMNNNSVIDRFEDDQEPDYPYDRDLRGANLYAGMALGRHAQVAAGRLRERQLSTGRHNRSTYGVLSSQWNLPSWKVVAFGHVKRVADDIADDRLVWSDVVSTMVGYTDPLEFTDALGATGYVQAAWTGFHRLGASGKVKYERCHQLDERPGWRDRTFWGSVQRAAWQLPAGKRLEFRPQWKSVYQRAVPTSRRELTRQELTESLCLVGTWAVLPTVRVDFGVERTYFANMQRRPDPVPTDYAEDYRSWVGGILLSNRSAYQGYSLTLNAGYQYERQNYEQIADRSLNTLYLRLFAALGQ